MWSRPSMAWSSNWPMPSRSAQRARDNNCEEPTWTYGAIFTRRLGEPYKMFHNISYANRTLGRRLSPTEALYPHFANLPVISLLVHAYAPLPRYWPSH